MWKISIRGIWGPIFSTVACAATVAAAGAACRVLENTGGGTGLTTTPDKELPIPFTTTATQTLQSSAGWVSGSVSITNTAQVAITLTSFTLDLGSGGVSQPVSQCQMPTVAVGSATSCAFNVSAPSAPAAGSVTATVDYSLTSTTGASTATATSAATPYSFTGGCGCDASWAAGSLGPFNSKVLCDVLLPHVDWVNCSFCALADMPCSASVERLWSHSCWHTSWGLFHSLHMCCVCRCRPGCVHTAAETYNIGSQATLYLAIDSSSLTTLPGVWGTNTAQTTNNLVRIEPPDAAPPQTPPGITVTQTTAYTYNVIVSKLMTCMDSRTVRDHV